VQVTIAQQAHIVFNDGKEIKVAILKPHNALACIDGSDLTSPKHNNFISPYDIRAGTHCEILVSHHQYLK